MYSTHSRVLVAELADDYQLDYSRAHQLSIEVETVDHLVKTNWLNHAIQYHRYPFRVGRYHCLFRSRIGRYHQHLYPALGLYFWLLNWQYNFGLLRLTFAQFVIWAFLFM